MVVRTVRAVSRETMSSFERIKPTSINNPNKNALLEMTQNPIKNDQNLKLKAQGENFKVYAYKY